MTLEELKIEARSRSLMLICQGLDTYRLLNEDSERLLEAVGLEDVEAYLWPDQSQRSTDLEIAEPVLDGDLVECPPTLAGVQWAYDLAGEADRRGHAAWFAFAKSFARLAHSESLTAKALAKAIERPYAAVSYHVAPLNKTLKIKALDFRDLDQITLNDYVEAKTAPRAVKPKPKPKAVEPRAASTDMLAPPRTVESEVVGAEFVDDDEPSEVVAPGLTWLEAAGQVPTVEAFGETLRDYIAALRDPQDLADLADLLRTYAKIAARWSRARQAAA